MKSKTLFTYCILLISCFASISTQQVYAQDNKIFELKSESNTHRVNNDDNEVPYQLLYSLKPTIYVKNNTIINVTGPGNPVSLTTSDANSLNILKTDNPLFNNIQIIKIQLNEPSDLINFLDVSSIKGFNNLSYFYIMCYFKCTENQIRAFIKNANPEITIYFEEVNPS